MAIYLTKSKLFVTSTKYYNIVRFRAISRLARLISAQKKEPGFHRVPFRTDFACAYINEINQISRSSVSFAHVQPLVTTTSFSEKLITSNSGSE